MLHNHVLYLAGERTPTRRRATTQAPARSRRAPPAPSLNELHAVGRRAATPGAGAPGPARPGAAAARARLASRIVISG